LITVQILDEAMGLLYIIRISALDYFVLSQCSRLTANWQTENMTAIITV